MTPSTGIVRDDVCSIRVLLWPQQITLPGNLLFTRNVFKKTERLTALGDREGGGEGVGGMGGYWGEGRKWKFFINK